jgi:hypothetical protein
MTMYKIGNMRGFLASSIGVTCAAALALPLTPPVVAATTRPMPAAEAEAATTVEAVAAPAVRHAAEPYLPGSTQSLPLAPLVRALGPPTEQGLARRDVSRFSLVGVVWDNPDVELHGRVQVRTRAAGTDTWSGWQDVETHNAEHAPDPDTAERTSGRVRGATAPLWVGDSDGVEVRVRAEAEGAAGAGAGAASPLPVGLRLELVDPGSASEPPQHIPVGAARAAALRVEADEALAASAVNAGLASLGAAEIPAEARRSKPYVGPRPRIVTRRGWGANESWRERKFVYTKKVKAAFVHHTATGNKYKCSQAPSLIRGIYRYHVKSMGWRDIGYNFLVDKCGTVYEGRAGGAAKPVLGAHTLGFNTNSMGIAVLGTFGSAKPSSAAVKAVARLAAWKLGLYGANPRGKTYLKSGGGNLYRKGKKVRLNVISGHRDGFFTECPGRQLYRKLGSARTKAAHYQGR